jgi:hypothetical protein
VEEELILRRLVDQWVETVQPFTNVSACVLAARVGHEVLDYFGIPHTVQPVFCSAVNDKMWAQVLTGKPMTNSADDGSWGVGAGKGVGDGTGWPGHVVLITDKHYIDLTVEQFDRPKKDIVSGGPLVAPLHEFELIDNEAVTMLYRPLSKGRLMWMPQENPSYKQTIDWRANYKLVAGPIIRSIKQGGTQ